MVQAYAGIFQITFASGAPPSVRVDLLNRVVLAFEFTALGLQAFLLPGIQAAGQVVNVVAAKLGRVSSDVYIALIFIS